MVAGREHDRIRLQPWESELSNLYDASGWQRCATRRRYRRTWHSPEVVARWEDDLFHYMRQVRVQRRLSDLRGEARRVFGALAPLQACLRLFRSIGCIRRIVVLAWRPSASPVDDLIQRS